MPFPKEANPAENVPNASMYKLEDAPELMRIQEKFAKEGLHDPWLRNHVWRYNPRFGTPFRRACNALFCGSRVGFAAFLLTIGVEYAFGISYEPHHEHHEEHH